MAGRLGAADWDRTEIAIAEGVRLSLLLRKCRPRHVRNAAGPPPRNTRAANGAISSLCVHRLGQRILSCT